MRKSTEGKSNGKTKTGHLLCLECGIRLSRAGPAINPDKHMKRQLGTYLIMDMICKHCDLYYASQWKYFGYKSFKDSQRNAKIIRSARLGRIRKLRHEGRHNQLLIESTPISQQIRTK